VPEGIPQTFNASWTRAGVTGMCSSRLAGEAMKCVTIAPSFLGPESCARRGADATLQADFMRRNIIGAAGGVEF